MKNQLILLLSVGLLPAVAQAQETKKVEVSTQNPGRRETYFVLRDDRKVKHGPYQLEQARGPMTKPLLTGFYKQGQRDSTWTEYGWGGKHLATGQYRQDQKVGMWNYYTAGDTLVQQYDYTARILTYARIKPSEKAKKYTIIRGSEIKQVQLDQPPLFIGGPDYMFAFVGSNVRYPVQALRNRVDGKVIIEILINEQGHATGHRVKQSVGSGCDEESLRVAKLLPDTWVAGVLGNQPVATMVEVPFTFAIK